MQVVKTESGAKVKATKTGIYKKWKERSHKKVYLKGASNERNAEETMSLPGNDLKLKLEAPLFFALTCCWRGNIGSLL